MATALEGKQICKTYDIEAGSKIDVLKNVDMKIEEGEFVAVMGQSGSGKSTLLYCISGMDAISSGEVFLRGRILKNFRRKK